MPVIETRGLCHVYSRGTPFEKVAVDHIDLTLGEGELIGLIGRTGSGKSTFIQHLNGLLRPTEGQVLCDGVDIHSSKQTRRDIRFRVGLVFQYPEYQLFEETVYKDIAFGPGNMGLNQAEIDDRVREAAGFAGVEESLFSLSPLSLSGGQKRRVAIAGVMAMRPGVLILDEPTAGLDPRGREALLENLTAYQRSTGSTVLLVSHSMEDIARIARRILVFDRGRVTMDGTPAEIFSHTAELKEMGLAVPAAASLAERLRTMGVALPRGICTVEQLADAILAQRGGGASC